MGEDKFDAIIVGGGLAGSAAAYVLASEGLEVIVIERGNYSGSKNMTGGRLYAHSLEQLMPGFAAEAPVERKITQERLSYLTEEGITTLEYASRQLKRPGSESYSVLRGRFDKWLAEKAEEAGAMYVYGIRVDDLILRDGKVCGVVAGDEEMEANAVILADGVNSLLAQKLGLREDYKPDQMAVGVKETIFMDAAVLQERFGVSESEGVAWQFKGNCTDGHIGEGFLYTNKDSISLGVITSLADLSRTETSVPEMLEQLKRHPAIEPLLAGGKLAEYSAHLVYEGGYNAMPPLYGNGVLLAGDAASMTIHTGNSIRGMDLAIESGRLAAVSLLQAREKDDFSAENLACYGEMLQNSFVLKDMRAYRDMPENLEDGSLYQKYPELTDQLLQDIFVVDGQGKKELSEVAVVDMVRNLLRGV